MDRFISPQPLRTIDVVPHPTAREKAVAKVDLIAGSTILTIPAWASVLLFSQKGHRCDHCLKLPEGTSRLKRCNGCAGYWYCDTQCQAMQWQLHHKRLCKKLGIFTASTAYQSMEEHSQMDAMLLTHLLAQLSILDPPYDPEKSQDLARFLSLLGGPSVDTEPPPVCGFNPPPGKELPATLFKRFGNNNFTVHSHLNSIAHGIFPLASRLFNHSCVPNSAPKYILSHSQPVVMEIVALRDIKAGEELCIPYLDPALMQTKHKILQYTYGFTCTCPSCNFLTSIGKVPDAPINPDGLKDLSRKLQEFIRIDAYLSSDDYRSPPLQDLPKDLFPVLNENFMNNLSEAFSKASHEGDFTTSANSGITLLALYLLVYPSNYPQIGMHLLEMAKTYWNYSFVISQPSNGNMPELNREISRLLVLARRVLNVMGAEGDEEGPFQEISILEEILKDA